MGFRPTLQCCAPFQHNRLGPKSRHKPVGYPIAAVPLLHQEAHLVWKVNSMALRSTVRKDRRLVFSSRIVDEKKLLVLYKLTNMEEIYSSALA